MKVVVEIPDQSAAFGLQVLRSLSFVKKAKPISDSSLQLLQDLNEAAAQVRLHKEGKIELKTAQQFLNEL